MFGLRLYLTIYFAICVSRVRSLCPKPELIPDCECRETTSETVVKCNGDFIKILSLSISNFHFNKFYIQSTDISSISDNSFGNSTFDEIYIEDNQLLRSISEKAFDRNQPRRLYIRNNKQLSDTSLFLITKNLLNIEFVDFSRNAIKEIPSYAFKQNNSSLTSKLVQINLNGNNITAIKSNSFNGLKQLSFLSLAFNQINRIEDNGLTFDIELINHELTIDLSHNRLVDQSFSAKSLDNKQRNNVKIVLHLNNNLLTKLDQNIFRTFLDTRRNYLDLRHNKFLCDCSLKWIKNLSVSENILDHTIDCENFNNKSLFVLTDSQLNCLPTSSTTPGPGHRCPPAEDIKPCICDSHSSEIYCISSTISDKKLETVGSKLKGLDFHSINIRETSITSIDKNLFSDVSFESVTISSNKHLTKVDSKAFHYPQEVIKDQRNTILNINRNPELEDISIYQLAVNLSVFSIDFSGNGLKEIPSEAFKSSDNSSQVNNKLESINLSYNKIVSIGANAFKGLLKLDYLNLAYNQISKIGDLGITSSRIHRNLVIELNFNQISSQSFTNGLLPKPDNISMTVLLGNNRFTNLTENIFKNLIESSDVKIFFNNNRFLCDCSMKWLLRSNISNKTPTFSVPTMDTKSIFDMQDQQLTCPPLILTTDTTTVQTTIETTTHKMVNKCPESQVLSPCVCDQSKLSINCESIIDSDLTRIGPKLSGSYQKLSISDSKVTAIDKNTFTNVTFDTIIIEFNPHLQTIDSDAFKQQTTKNLSISYNKIFDDPNVFDLIRNLNPIEINITGNAIRKIPAKSFSKDNTMNTRLKVLNFDYNRLEKIESNAFAGLKSLIKLNLNHNSIAIIEENGLKFETNFSRLSVFLDYNKLNSSSFTSKSIEMQQNVSLSLYLENNELKTLNETVFKSFIEGNGNEIYLTGNKFSCDCNMKWILENSHKNNIYHVFCNNKLIDIFKLNIKDLTC